MKHLVLQALEPAVYLGRRRSTSILQVGGVYIGFKCHKTLRWQALWDVIKHKYDWSAMVQWRHCLWDGLWLCQELAAKSIDPDAIAACTTNTQGFMDLSHLEAADNLSILTHSYLKWTVYLYAPSHFLIYEFGSSLAILTQAAGDHIVFILNMSSSETEDAPMKERDFRYVLTLLRHSSMTKVH